jgi:hypothetical protein
MLNKFGITVAIKLALVLRREWLEDYDKGSRPAWRSRENSRLRVAFWSSIVAIEHTGPSDVGAPSVPQGRAEFCPC